MTMLKREEWQHLVRDVGWDYTYVDHEAVYPEWHSGTGKVPVEAWQDWEESYKVTYPEYVATQNEKEHAAYAVKAALQRSKAFENLDEGWKSSTKMHFGGVTLVEAAAIIGELKMARFGLNPGWRNMAIFGALDEMRHTQITLFFAREFVGKDPQYDWAQKTFHTNEWGAIALRSLFDAMITSPNVVDLAIQLPSSPANLWMRTYRDLSPLQAGNWDAFRDPDAMIYRKYVAMQHEQENAVSGVLDEYSDAGHDAGLSARWLDTLEMAFCATRFPLHGTQQVQAYIGMMAPSSYITHCAVFAAADLLRRVSLVAYRTRELDLSHPGRGFGTGERALWQDHEAWQPARELIELALVTPR